MRTRPPHVVPLILASCGALLLASCAAHAPPAPPSAPAAPAAPAAHAASAASGARSPHDAGADFPWAAPELARLVSARDGATGAPLAWDALLDELAGADTVFLGETHTDGTTHRVELGVYDGLLARRGGRVVLALEMLERDVQGALDDYLAGRSGEAAFLAASRPWSNYATAYRPLIERAREAGRPVVASNFPRTLRGQVGKEGAAALDALRASGSRDIPSELLANTDGYWRRVDNAVRGHQAMLGAMPGAMGDVSAQARLISVQSLWDNTMGESCARALDEHPGDLVLHVNGGFHSAYRDGTVRQLRLRKPQARVLTVAIVPVDSPATADVAGLPEADYVVFAEARSRDVEHGEGAVMVPREVRYRLHVPPQASGSARVPLLLWLSDDGLLAEDELELLRARLGDEIAIAVVEAPAVELQEDLAPGGRWFTSDDFTQDAEGVRLGVERTWALLLQQQPVDPARVCLAGAGTGATAVAATALLAERLGARCIAWQPRGDASIRDIPLPLPELRGDQPRPDVSLRVLAGPRTSAWWKDELAGYAGVGLPAELVALSADPWTAPLQFENELREALGLPARAEASVAAPTASAAPSATAPTSPAATPSAAASPPAAAGRAYVLVEEDAPRAREWAERFALRVAARDGRPVAVLDAAPEDPSAVRLPLQVRAADFAADGALPQCPGDFGGTTVLVLPAGTTPDETAAWKAIEAADPLNRQSRFHRLRVATTAPGDILAVLAELAGAGRTNVLVVPAVFHADAGTMLALKRGVRGVADGLSLHWSPGLGKSLQPGDAVAVPAASREQGPRGD